LAIGRCIKARDEGGEAVAAFSFGPLTAACEAPDSCVILAGVVTDPRITWERGERQQGPTETIGVLEIQADGGCRAVFAERVEVDGRCHVLLARKAWGGKIALDTRWWSLVLDGNQKVETIRNGSCGDRLTKADVPRIIRALSELDLITDDTGLM
jgi:hypothetical protein